MAASVPPTVIWPGTGVGAFLVQDTSTGRVFRLERPNNDIIQPGTGVSYTLVPTNGIQNGIPLANSDLGALTGSRLPPRQPTAVFPVLAPMLTGGAGESASATSGSKLTLPDTGVEPLSYSDYDSNLRDCDIPFPELKKRSAYCLAGDTDKGARCERFSFSQFPEVFRLAIYLPDNSLSVCTGTLVTPSWGLTAAHCFLDREAVSAFQNGSTADLVINLGSSDQKVQSATAAFLNSRMLARDKREVSVDKVVIDGGYSGYDDHRPPQEDLALVHLAIDIPRFVAEPAVIASGEKISLLTFKDAITMAGYGFSTVGNGTFAAFEVGWADKVSRSDGFIVLTPDGAKDSGVCNGDSGGPVFAGYSRGCKRTDLVKENRPRLIEGVISYLVKGDTSPSTRADSQQLADCEGSPKMLMQDITTDSRRRWICRNTNKLAEGCR